ncbi:beta-lactamase domain protein [Candidatus Moduliflexus flocculans]|uniref:Beta-lactamase domain protein n=1 Tax=Candidatus Moduliflexus flocculans TaxID=1499966 RepID=A0A081BPA3_9BACT|nr:beta-lactamase domain protein [Candidatus Moduliflexus flocculans]
MSSLHYFESNIWLTEVPLGDYSVRGALIVGAERVVAWDTLSHPHDMARVFPLLDEKELVIIYSHADWDHAWGTAGLPYHHATIIGHAACLARFSDDVPLTLREKQAAEPTRWDAVQLIAPNLTFQQELSLDLGDETLTLRHLPGHTPDSIVAFLPEQGILFAGDTVETPLPCLSEHCPLAPWIAELQRWADDGRVRLVIPSHGAIGGRELLHRNIEYLQRLANCEPIDFAEPLNDFYRETHEMNRRIANSFVSLIRGY